MVMSVASSLGLGVGKSVCSLLSLLFCCRCGGAFFFAVVAGAPFFCCRTPGRLLFSCCRPGARFFLLSLRGTFFCCCCRPRERALFLLSLRGRVFFWLSLRGRDFFWLSLRGRVFFAVVAGTGAHSLTGFLGPRNDNKNQHKTTNYSKKTRVSGWECTPNMHACRNTSLCNDYNGEGSVDLDTLILLC